MPFLCDCSARLGRRGCPDFFPCPPPPTRSLVPVAAASACCCTAERGETPPRVPSPPPDRPRTPAFFFCAPSPFTIRGHPPPPRFTDFALFVSRPARFRRDEPGNAAAAATGQPRRGSPRTVRPPAPVATEKRERFLLKAFPFLQADGASAILSRPP